MMAPRVPDRPVAPWDHNPNRVDLWRFSVAGGRFCRRIMMASLRIWKDVRTGHIFPVRAFERVRARRGVVLGGGSLQVGRHSIIDEESVFRLARQGDHGRGNAHERNSSVGRSGSPKPPWWGSEDDRGSCSRSWTRWKRGYDVGFAWCRGTRRCSSRGRQRSAWAVAAGARTERGERSARLRRARMSRRHGRGPLPDGATGSSLGLSEIPSCGSS